MFSRPKEGTKCLQMIVPVENRMCPSGLDLEGREIGSFRNLSWLYITYLFDGGGSMVGPEEMDWGRALGA